MAGGMMMKLLCVMFACMVVSAPYAESAITCGQVVSKLMPCLNYLRGTGGAVPPACCSGVKGLNSAASTTPDRKTTCNCLKTAYASYKGIKPAIAEGLPSKCSVNIPYKISPSTDCAKVV